jgi:hypothetical protein
MHAANTIPELDAKGLRDFGLLTGGIVAVLFGLLLPWLLDRAWPVWPWLIGGGLAAWGVAAPLTMRPLYRGWMRLGLLIGKVMTPFILAVLFFLVVTPVGMVRRLVAGDPMPKHRDGSAETYRVAISKRSPEDLKRPF